MSLILKKFYRIYWSNKTCMNLFSLSKDELLDTHSNTALNIKYSKPRIIISNIRETSGLALEIIKNRTDSRALDEEDNIVAKLDKLEPVLRSIYDKDFKKAIGRVLDDYKNRPLRFLWQFFRLGANPETAEDELLTILKKYGLIGKHLNNFDDVKQFFTQKYLGKNSDLLDEDNIRLIEEFILFLKNLQLNAAYKGMYESNQVLVNSLHEEDDFQSRIHLFRLLYESDIISNSQEDAFIECTNCEKGRYRGTISLMIPPSKLDKLVCPLCGEKLTYFISFQLHSDLYEVIKAKDGLLFEVMSNLLENEQVDHELNCNFLDDIEIDCIAQIGGVNLVIEVKMFKLNTTRSKLKQKVKASYKKLLQDVDRLCQSGEIKDESLTPLLLLNISNNSLLNQIIDEIKSEEDLDSVSIVNIVGFKEFVSDHKK